MNQIIAKFSALSQVKGIVIGGSRATESHDDLSDWDLYIYTNAPIPLEERKNLLEPHVSYMEYANTFWEEEDDGTLKDGVPLEIIYRDINDFKTHIQSLMKGDFAYNGYTTCMAHHIAYGIIEYDPDQILTLLKNQVLAGYPDLLQDKIITKNLSLLKDMMPSFYFQVEKAYMRNDLFSINHRFTELIASYFDIIFALNKVYHPGEKGLIEKTSHLSLLPHDHAHTLEHIFTYMFSNGTAAHYYTRKLIQKLYNLLDSQGIAYSKQRYYP